MNFKFYGSALVLAALASTAFGQAANQTEAPAITEHVARHQHGPVQNHHGREDGTSTSTNWSGYAVTGTAFTNVQGSWVVPTVNCSVTPGTRSNPTYSSFWVGLDGYSSNTVEQTGTDSDCDGSTPTYYAWYEFYPAASCEINLAVTPGNIMSASVTYSGSEFTVTITNVTTGKSYTKSSTVRNAKRSSAEWIAEAPCCTRGGGILPLADFQTVSFGGDTSGVNNTNYATETSLSGPISAFGANVDQIDIVTSSDAPEDTSSSLSSDGTSFTVTWKSE